MDWFRFYNEAMHDLKIKRIVRKLKTDLAHVMGAWVILLCLANNDAQRGKLMIGEDDPLTVDDLAETIGVEPEFAARWLQEFMDAGLLRQVDGIYEVANFNKRQFISDNSTDRVRKHREGKKQEGNVSETLRSVTVKQSETPPDTDTDTDTETNSIPATEEVQPTDEPVGDCVSLLNELFPCAVNPTMLQTTKRLIGQYGEALVQESLVNCLAQPKDKQNLGWCASWCANHKNDGKPQIQLKQGGQTDPADDAEAKRKEEVLRRNAADWERIRIAEQRRTERAAEAS